MTADEIAGWPHQLNGHEFGQAMEDSGGQGSLVCCSPWGCKESDTTEELNNIKRVTEDDNSKHRAEKEEGGKGFRKHISYLILYSESPLNLVSIADNDKHLLSLEGC